MRVGAQPVGMSRAGRGPHSFLVLVPIVCWPTGLLLDVGSRFSAAAAVLVRVSTWLVGVGLVGAVVAGVAGMVAAVPVSAETPAYRWVLVHLGLVMTLLVVSAMTLVVRTAIQHGQPAELMTLASSAVAVLLLSLTSYAGRGVRRRRRAPQSAGTSSGPGHRPR